MLDKTILLQELNDFNPWWKGSFPTEGRLYHRHGFASLLKLLPLEPIVAVTGLRRTGKTTLLFQLLHHLIEHEKISPQRICRYQFEERLIPPTDRDLDLIIRTFLESILNEDIHTTKRTFFFFDELQFVEGWQAVLKKYYDLNKHLKFFVSGSSSLFLRKATRESLAGRVFEEMISPLSFREYLEMTGQFQDDMPHTQFSFNELDDKLFETYRQMFSLHQEKREKAFTTFMVRGQFPEAVSFPDSSLVFRYLRESVITKIIEYDLPKLYGFRKSGELATLLFSLAKETGNILEYSNLAAEIGISLLTIKEYISAFKDSYLLDLLFSYTKKHRRGPRQLKKGYIVSPNFTCALHGMNEFNLINNPVMGHLVETEVFNHLRQHHPISFWNSKGKEVDFLLSLQKELLPIEVKYTNRLRKEDLADTLFLMKKKKLSAGLVITKHIFDSVTVDGKRLYMIPAWIVM